MIDEKLDESIQKFAQSTRLNDAGRRAGFEGYQPTQSIADRQGEAQPVAQNVPPPPPRPAPPSVQTRTDTSLPNVRAGSVYRDASGLHTGQYVTQKDFEEGNAQVEAYKRAHPQVEGRVTSNRYRGDSWNRPAQTFMPSATAPRNGAAQFRQAAQQPAQTVQPVNRIQQIDQRAEAEAKAKAEKREQARRDANVSVGEAFSEALRKFRDDSTAITKNGIEKRMGKDRFGNDVLIQQNSANRYRIGMLQPSTIRALNQQRSALGLKESDSIVGIYAVSSVDANGKPTGEPQIITNYRSADGRIHKKVYTYQEAARFVRGTMGEKGDASADDRFVSMKQWQDADGNDALGITRTAEYQERKAKLEADQQKSALTAAQTQAAQDSNVRANNAEQRAQTKFEQEQRSLAEQEEMKPVTEAMKEFDNYTKLATSAKDAETAQNFFKLAAAARTRAENAQTAINNRRTFNALKDGDPVSFMPGAVKKGNEMVAAEGYEEKGGRFVLKNGYMLDKNKKAVLRNGWTLDEDGNPVPPKKPPTASGESASESASPAATSVQEKPLAPSQQYAKDYNARIKEFTDAGGEYSRAEDGKGKPVIRIANYWVLPDEIKNRVKETSTELTPEVVNAQKRAKEIFDTYEASYQKERLAEEDRLRKEVLTRDRTKNRSPEEQDEWVRRRLEKWDRKHIWVQGKNAKQKQDSMLSSIVNLSTSI